VKEVSFQSCLYASILRVTQTGERGRIERVKRALANPVFFAETYVRPYDANWNATMPKFAQDMMKYIRRTRRGVIMLPPEFMKTTLCSQVYPLWLTYRAGVMKHLLRGLLVSEEEGLAAGNLGVVAWHIQNNELLARDFVDHAGNALVYPDPEENTWNNYAIIVNREGATKDPTWQAKGLDSKGIQGRRLDVLIGDDLITPKNSASPTLRRRALDFWDLQFETRLVASGQAVICGNFNDVRDLLSTLSSRPGYTLFRRPSITRHDDPTQPPNEADMGDPEKSELTWPEVWPRDRLMDERRMKPNRFRRIHLLDSRAESGEALKIEWMRIVPPEETPLRYSKFYMGLDPAPGGGNSEGDFFNITVGALHGGNLDIVESFDVRADIPRQCELVGLFHDRYQRLGRGLMAIGGAKITFDRYFRGALGIARPDLAHKLVEIGVAGSKEERLEALGPFAQSGFLRTWEPIWLNLTSDLDDQWSEMSLMEQWRDFPHGRFDDKLDGLDVMVRTAREFGNIGDIEWNLEVLEA
jgi:hypothetical protein